MSNKENKKKRKRGLRPDQESRVLQDLLSRLRCQFQEGRHFLWTHQEFIDKWHDDPLVQKYKHRLTAASSGYLAGYRAALWEENWKLVEWCLFIDGELRTKDEVRQMEAEEQKKSPNPLPMSVYRRVDTDKSCHCWIEDGKIRKDKPYSMKKPCEKSSVPDV